jgi:hypothetical protein
MKQFAIYIFFAFLLISCSTRSNNETILGGEQDLENSANKATSIATSTNSPTKTRTPTIAPSVTPEPEPTKQPTPEFETYGHQVVWLDPKIQNTLDNLKKVIYDELSPLDGFTIELKNPVVDIKNLPEGVKCYGWEYEDSVKCLYAEKGKKYYCDPNQNGWPVCYPPGFTDPKIEDGSFLGLYEGALSKSSNPSNLREYFTEEMYVGLGESDYILSAVDGPTIQLMGCLKNEPPGNNTLVFAVPLPRYMGLAISNKAQIKDWSTRGNIDCAGYGQFTIWDINP